MDYFNDILTELLKLKGQGLVLAFCIALGYILKLTPIFPNGYIPHAVIAFGAGLNPCIIGRGNVEPDVSNPIAHLVLQGFLIGVAAFALHHLVISKLEEKFKAFTGKLPLLLLGLALAVSGCKHLSPQGKAFVALKDTQVSVDAAMKIYAARYAEGKVSAESREKIHRAHHAYRVHFESAIVLAEFDYSKATPESVGALATELLNLIAQLNL